MRTGDRVRVIASGHIAFGEEGVFEDLTPNGRLVVRLASSGWCWDFDPHDLELAAPK